MPDPLPPNASLNDVLSDRARRATPSRLGMDVLGGALVAAFMLWARSFAWRQLASAAACLFFYGLWAIAQRRLTREDAPVQLCCEPFWFTVRFVTGLLGLGAFVMLVLTALAAALGTIIS